MDKLNVDCIIRPRNDNSVLLTTAEPSEASSSMEYALRCDAWLVGGAMCPCGE